MSKNIGLRFNILISSEPVLSSNIFVGWVYILIHTLKMPSIQLISEKGEQVFKYRSKDLNK